MLQQSFRAYFVQTAKRNNHSNFSNLSRYFQYWVHACVLAYLSGSSEQKVKLSGSSEQKVKLTGSTFFFNTDHNFGYVKLFLHDNFVMCTPPPPFPMAQLHDTRLCQKSHDYSAGSERVKVPIIPYLICCQDAAHCELVVVPQPAC